MLDKNIVDFANALAYRYVDYSQDPDGKAVELTWEPGGHALTGHRRPAAAGDVAG